MTKTYHCGICGTELYGFKCPNCGTEYEKPLPIDDGLDFAWDRIKDFQCVVQIPDFTRARFSKEDTEEFLRNKCANMLSEEIAKYIDFNLEYDPNAKNTVYKAHVGIAKRKLLEDPTVV